MKHRSRSTGKRRRRVAPLTRAGRGLKPEMVERKGRLGRVAPLTRAGRGLKPSVRRL